MASNFDATLEGILPESPDGTEIILSVSEFTTRIQRVLEGAFAGQWVQGEISNFVAAASGHWYFNLKDEQAQIRCVMFRFKNQRVDWKPANGMAVELRGVTTFYGPNGSCQIMVDALRQTGLGRLYEAFNRLKAQLAAEGLFDPARKRPLPPHPAAIGIVTSTAAAALRDVLTTLKRRSPGTPVIIYPTPVQGEGAAAQIARAIRQAGERAECDVLIVCRGGGSIEDLWAFNEPEVARAIAASPIVVITGVGHETDFTIADFVADQRAPTPTAAAEMVTPDREALLRHLAALRQRLQMGLQRRTDREGMRLDHAVQRLRQVASRTLERERQKLQLMERRLVHPGERLRQQSETLAVSKQRLQRAIAVFLQQRQQMLQRLDAGLGHLNPEAVLSRGFSIVRSTGGHIVRSSAEVGVGDSVELTFAAGSAGAAIQSVTAPGPAKKP